MGIDLSRASAHLCRRVMDASLRTEPFEHLVVENVLPSDIFEAIMSGFPDEYPCDVNCKPRSWIAPAGMVLGADSMEGGVSGRGNNAALLYWRSHAVERERMLSLFASIEFRGRFVNTLLTRFERQLNEALAQFKTRFANQVTVSGGSRLTLDSASYELMPHTDRPNKLASLVVYLRATSGADLGTTLYRPKIPTFTCAGELYHPFSHFVPITRVPFQPNSAFFFIPTDASFHGVRFKSTDAKFSRLTLQTNIWMTNPGDAPLVWREGI